MNRRLPEWLTVKASRRGVYEEMAGFLKSMDLHTVCQSASCPNIGECFLQKTATFMILGDVCTRNCRFCGVPKGPALDVDPEEPMRVADAAFQMGLRYIVVTSVTRDDLPDGGASQFAKTIEAIKARIAGAKVEVLVPDFGGSTESIETVLKAEPLVLNHNVETAPRLYPQVRPQARFERSLQLLETSKVLRPSVYTKSGLMVGLGESKDEVVEVLHALRRAQCDIVTIGQYLPPSRRHLPVVEYVHPSRFAEYKAIGESIGFRYVASGPFIRSSYHASEFSPENSS
jgi:lipoic acid synthetase